MSILPRIFGPLAAYLRSTYYGRTNLRARERLTELEAENAKLKQLCLDLTMKNAPSVSPAPLKRLRAPIPIAEGRALVQIPSGETLCVDTNSIDSINYLLGWEIERAVLAAFTRFLRADSVVLDIGANFGLYTAVCGRVVRKQGKLYAFEANPHTFDCLRRSAHANDLNTGKRVALVNALVAAKGGRGKLFFSHEELGGATMTVSPRWGNRRREVEVDMITIDEFLAPNEVVDLVKIDVEGHEPSVIHGMEKTIARSPNIRIFIEFFEHMLERTFGAQRFVNYIHDLGFRLCRIKGDSQLELLEPGVVPRGENYCLLTRTPEEDAQRWHFAVSLESLSYHREYFRGEQNLLLKDGVLLYEKGAFVTTPPPVLFFGPYRNIPPGTYRVRLSGEIRGSIRVRLTSDFGRTTYAEQILDDLQKPVPLTLPAHAENFEIVATRMPDLESLTIRGINIELVR